MTQRDAHQSVEALHESMKGFSLGAVRDLELEQVTLNKNDIENVINFKTVKFDEPNQNLTILKTEVENLK